MHISSNTGKALTGAATLIERTKFHVKPSLSKSKTERVAFPLPATRITAVEMMPNYLKWTSKGMVGEKVAEERYKSSPNENARVLPPTDAVVNKLAFFVNLSTASVFVKQSRGIHLKKVSELVPEMNYIWASVEPAIGEDEKVFKAYFVVYTTFIRCMCNDRNVYGNFFNAVRDSRKVINMMDGGSVMAKITDGGKKTWYQIFCDACAYPVTMIVDAHYVENPTELSAIPKLLHVDQLPIKADEEGKVQMVAEEEGYAKRFVDVEAPEKGPSIATRLLGEDCATSVANLRVLFGEILRDTHEYEWSYHAQMGWTSPCATAMMPPKETASCDTSVLKVFAKAEDHELARNSEFIAVTLYYISQASIADMELEVKPLPGKKKPA